MNAKNPHVECLGSSQLPRRLASAWGGGACGWGRGSRLAHERPTPRQMQSQAERRCRYRSLRVSQQRGLRVGVLPAKAPSPALHSPKCELRALIDGDGLRAFSVAPPGCLLLCGIAALCCAAPWASAPFLSIAFSVLVLLLSPS